MQSSKECMHCTGLPALCKLFQACISCPDYEQSNAETVPDYQQEVLTLHYQMAHKRLTVRGEETNNTN
ncbi:unnamed protein product [Caretta caretta]